MTLSSLLAEPTLTGPTPDWRALFLEVTERVRRMATNEPALAPSPDPLLFEVMNELDLLDARYAEKCKQVALDTKRHLADLAELHNANRLVTVGTLTVGLTHEFGTPLGVVLARAQMILNDHKELEEARKDSAEIIRQVQRMTQMCREVLDYARPKPPAKRAVDVAQLARQMIALLSLDARKRSAKLVFAGDGAPSFVLGDSSKLMQVMTNLIINGAQAMPKGGTLTVSLERKRVQPPKGEGLAEGEYVCMHVKDTGTGILGADLERIFDTFFTTRKEGEGTGLGLAVSHRIMREHSGWIGVETEEGKGSTFTIYLPPTDPSGHGVGLEHADAKR